MKPSLLIVTLSTAGLLLGACENAPPTEPELAAPSPSLAVAGNSGCVTVRFQVTDSLFFPSVPGRPEIIGRFVDRVTGDLVGSRVSDFTGRGPLTGMTRATYGTNEWAITGGVAGPLSFITALENRNVFGQFPVVMNLGSDRALEGVRKANFTYEGTFNFETGATLHNYHGVLCP